MLLTQIPLSKQFDKNSNALLFQSDQRHPTACYSAHPVGNAPSEWRQTILGQPVSASSTGIACP